MKLIILSLLAIMIACSQYVPIPKTEYGTSVGDLSGKLHIQAFYDLGCIDSKDSDSILQSVFKTISMAKSSIKFTYNIFPLPYHLYAFKITHGYQYIVSKTSPISSEKYIRFAFNNLDKYAEQKWLNSTINQFMDTLAKDVAAEFSVNQTDFRSALAHGSTSDAATRAEWKYGTSLGVSGTPIFYANGVRIDGADNYKYADWIKFFEKYTTVSLHEDLLSQQ